MKENKRTFEHADLEIKDLETVEKNGQRRYITPDGNAYPSVTTVLSILSEKFIAAWKARVGEEEAAKVSYRASQRGTAVHEIIEKYIDNEPDYAKGYMPNILENFSSVRGIIDERVGKVYAQECALYSDHLRLAGRVDCVAEFDGRISIIDFKTAKRKKYRSGIKQYFQQEAAYAIMFEERTGLPVSQLVTIIAVDDDKPQVFIEHRDEWAPELKRTIDVFNKRENESIA